MAGDVQQLIHKCVVPNLFFIPEIPSNPQMCGPKFFLNSSNFQEFHKCVVPKKPFLFLKLHAIHKCVVPKNLFQ
jgi:hypothetical protein